MSYLPFHVSQKKMNDPYSECRLCPYNCKADRVSGKLGRCGSGAKMRIARIAPHLWEEPCLSGQGLEDPIKGSGTVFFVGCSMHCVYCQNSKISVKGSTLGREFTPSELSDELLSLQALGVHNINFVTPTHFSPDIIETVKLAREKGLTLPIVYNCSGYETIEAVRSLRGTIDIFLPDFKYLSPILSAQYSSTPDYFSVASKAIKEMQNITGTPVFDKNGYLSRGTVVRHLVLPGSDSDSRKLVSYLHEEFGSNGIALSLMSQYTPMPSVPFPELTEKLPRSAYLRVIERAQSLEFKYLYTQDGEAASESFIPTFS